MSLTNKRISVVNSNTSNICGLLNVADEQHFLRNYMSADVFQECIAGATNVIRVEILCKNMINEIMAGSTKMYDALCKYFLERSKAYMCMYQRFIEISSTSGGSISMNSLNSQSDVLCLEERIKCLNQELLHLRQPHTSDNCQSELFAIEELRTETKAANADDRVNPDLALLDRIKVEMQEFESAVEVPHLIESELSKCHMDTNYSIKKEFEDVDWSENRNCQDAGDKISETMEIPELHKHRRKKLRSKVVRGKRMFICDYCERMFSQWASLQSHVRVHTKEKPFSCENCGMRFGHQTTLIRHVRTHTGEKPFTCEICGQSFGRNSTLVDHVRLHTGEKPFACEHCGKTFRIKRGLLRHIRVEHSSANLRLTNCRSADPS